METYSKKLTKTDVENRLFLEAPSLIFFPPFEDGQSAQVLRVEDEEEKEWFFRMIIRKGRYKKPVLSAGWLEFVKTNQVKSGFIVQFFKEENEATRQVKYKVKLKKPIVLFKTVIGYAPYNSPVAA